jgi:hypothetical protein
VAVANRQALSPRVSGECIERSRWRLCRGANVEIGESARVEIDGREQLLRLIGSQLCDSAASCELSAVSYRSGQTGQTVNLMAYAFAGSNPALTNERRKSSV